MADSGKNNLRAIIKIDPKILALYQKGPYDASRQKRFKFNVDVIPLELMYRELGIEEEKTLQDSEPSTRSVQEKVIDTVSKLKERSAPKEVLAQPQEDKQPASEVSLIDFDDATEENDHSPNYETPAKRHDETLHLPKIKIVRTGQATFHASQAGLENFLSDKDFEFTDEEFLEQAANVDDKLTVVKTKQELQEVLRDSIPFLIRGIRRIEAQSKLKLDSIGESQKLDQLLQEERKEKLKFQSEFNEMRKKCEAACKERDTVLYKNRALSDSLQNYRENSDTDKKEYNKLLEEFQQLKDGNREVENAAEELRRENENLRASRSSKLNQQAEAELQKQNQKLTEQNQRLRTELQQQRDAYAELQKKNGQDVNQIKSLRRQLTEEQKRINPNVDYVAELQQELATVKSQNEMYLSSSRAATSAVTKSREETLLATIEQYKVEIAAEKAEKEKLQKERRELRIEEEEQVEVLLEGLKKHRPGWYATLYRNRPETYEEFETQSREVPAALMMQKTVPIVADFSPAEAISSRVEAVGITLVKTMIDTGSSISVMSHQMAKDLDLYFINVLITFKGEWSIRPIKEDS
ncbi:myosin-2 heavy chain-like [Paramacrobiotus metropolitanus]|uniref:myosin-2 heavy chain-like n=1 Tax=Paramacrobiotus metropolitanus TaxID=2943436 RepID=UPI0024462F5C|nr:myosin-2 heavy chain-like [Paramacrobiotus metropolitanus]